MASTIEAVGTKGGSETEELKHLISWMSRPPNGRECPGRITTDKVTLLDNNYVACGHFEQRVHNIAPLVI